MTSTVSVRAAAVVAAVIASVAIAACGGGGSKSTSTPSAGTQTSTQASSSTGTSSSTAKTTSSGANAKTSTSSSSSRGGSGGGVSVKAGMTVFEQNCASCHTLAAAGSTGTVGPNLDQLKPNDALVIHQVTNGGGGMPAFGSTLSQTQIKSVALYVSSVAGKPVKGKVKKQHNATP